MSFVPFNANKYDFSKAALYRKTATVNESQIEIAKEPHEVITIIDGKEETRKQAKPGDYIISGAKGERYVIDASKFPTLYEKDPERHDTYVSKGVRKALRLDEDTIIPASWGPQNIAKGGVVVLENDGKNVYGIEQGALESTYGRADENGKVFVSMNAPLTTQLKEAGERGLDAHKSDILERIKMQSKGAGMQLG